MEKIYLRKTIRKKDNRNDICMEAEWLNKRKEDVKKYNMISNIELESTTFRNAKHIKGDLAENYAINYFIENSCYVFKNTSQHGCADICVLDKNGQIQLYDVKTITYKKNETKKIGTYFEPYVTYRINSKKKSTLQKKMNVKLIYVCVENLLVWIDDEEGQTSK